MTDHTTPDGAPDPIAPDLVATYAAAAERITSDAFDRLCDEHPDDAAAIRRQYEALKASGLIAAAGVATHGPDPWEAGAREALADPDTVGKYDAIGPYQPLKELGRGGQAVVFLAEDVRFHRPVALKVLKGLGPLSETMIQRFRREAEVTSRLEHPAICSIYDAGVKDGVAYIAMRFVEGRTLADALETANARRFKKGRRAERETSLSVGATTKTEIHRILEVLEQSARALHVAHEAGVVHRDVKPGNIMVTPSGEPVLLDFGLAGDEDGGMMTLTETGDILGTPAYMSPEQLMAKRIRVDRRTDVYSLGVTLFECLTLSRPYRANTREAIYNAIQYKDPLDIRKLNPSLPQDLKVIVETALEKDRDKRYQTAQALADDLRRVRAHEPISARPISAAGRVWRWAKRRPMRAALVSVLAIGIPVLTALASHAIARQPEIEKARQQGLADEVEAHLENGFNQLQNEDNKGAIASFDAALALKPDSMEAIGGKAWTLWRLKQFEQLLQLIEAPGVSQGDRTIFHQLRAAARQGLGLEPGAKPDVEAPTTALGAFLRGMNWLADPSAKTDKAVARAAYTWFERAVWTAPHARRLYHSELAHAAGYLGEEGPARRAAAALIRLWPDSAAANFQAAFAVSGFVKHPIDPELAERYYRRAIALNPDHAAAHTNLGASLFRKDRIDEAIAHWRTAIRLAPALAMPHLNLATAMMEKGKLDEALLHGRRAIECDANFIRGHLVLAQIHHERGHLDDAQKALEKALALRPDSGEALKHLGNVLLAAGRHDEALARFSKAVEADPENSDYHFHLGNALRHKGDDAAVVAAYEKAIELNPDNASAYTNLGTMCYDAGQDDRALAHFKKAIELTPEAAIIHFNLANVLVRKGDHAGAIAAYEKALALDPAYPKAREQVGVAYNRIGNRLYEKDRKAERAIVAYRKAIEANPDEAFYHCNLGNVLNDFSRDYPAAIECYKTANRLKPDFATVHRCWALALKRMQRYDEAAEQLRKRLALGPDADSYRMLGTMLSNHLRDYDGAVTALERAIELEPRNAEGHFALGVAKVNRGEREAAIACWRRVVELDPKHVSAHLNLGIAHRASGDFDTSLRFLKRTLALSPTNAMAQEHYAKVREDLALVPVLDGVLAGEREPADADEARRLARIAASQKKLGAAAMLGQHGIVTPEISPELTEKQLDAIYTTACYFALAGTGQGVDADRFDDRQRTEWRKRAAAWLTASAEAWAEKLERGKHDRVTVAKKLEWWKNDADLAGIRDEKAIARLPQSERLACTRLWAAVDALLARVKTTK